MSQPHIHTCPACGAPLVEGDQVLAQCSYCGNYVSVHEERGAPRSLPPAAPPPACPSVIAHDELGPADIARIQQLLRDRRRIEAIRYYRERLAPTPGLKQASDAVDAIERQMGLAPAKPADSYALPAFLALVVVGACLCLCVSIASQGQTQNKDAGPASAQTTPIHIAVQPTPTIVQPTPIASFGGEGNGPGLFQMARHITIDGNGNVYVSDAMTRRVQRFDENGEYLSEWSIEAKGKIAQTTGPEGLAADRAGNVYVVWTGLILKYEGVTGELLGTFAGVKLDPVAMQGDDFRSLAVGPDGELWTLSQIWRDDLMHLDANGKIVARNIRAVSIAAGKAAVFPREIAMAIDGQGNIYVLNYDDQHPAVFKFTSVGKFVKGFDAKAGDETVSRFSDRNPIIAVDNQNRVYFADIGGIRVFDEDGQYLGMISRTSYNDKAFGMAINSKNEIYVIGDDSLIFKLAPFK